MRMIHTFTRSAVDDLRTGSETWRVRALVVLYAIGGSAISMIAMKVLGS